MDTELAGLLRRLRGHPNLQIGAAITVVVVLLALVSLVWTPYRIEDQLIANRFATPSFAHPLGTDQYGRDTLTRIMLGAGNALMVGIVAVAIGAIVGVAVGLFAAIEGGVVEAVLMRCSDFVFAFPAILSAMLFTAWQGPGAINAIVAIGIFNIPVFARLARGSAKAVLAREFVRAAQAMGQTMPMIAIRHVLPNIAGVLVVQATTQFAIAILADAGLSYLGLGIQPPHPSWGKMLFDMQTMTGMAPMQAVYPGLAIVLSVLGFNLLGDGLRDLLDTRTVGRPQMLA
ncbi:MAG: ABC transporter permease [Alphaproteobacteria bacterium]